MLYKVFREGGKGSSVALQQVSKIVSSSTEFKQQFVCPVQFKAVWAMVVTWLEIPVLNEDYDDGPSGSGAGPCLTVRKLHTFLSCGTPPAWFTLDSYLTNGPNVHT